MREDSQRSWEKLMLLRKGRQQADVGCSFLQFCEFPGLLLRTFSSFSYFFVWSLDISLLGDLQKISQSHLPLPKPSVPCCRRWAMLSATPACWAGCGNNTDVRLGDCDLKSKMRCLAEPNWQLRWISLGLTKALLVVLSAAFFWLRIAVSNRRHSWKWYDILGSLNSLDGLGRFRMILIWVTCWVCLCF